MIGRFAAVKPPDRVYTKKRGQSKQELIAICGRADQLVQNLISDLIVIVSKQLRKAVSGILIEQVKILLGIDATLQTAKGQQKEKQQHKYIDTGRSGLQQKFFTAFYTVCFVDRPHKQRQRYQYEIRNQKTSSFAGAVPSVSETEQYFFDERYDPVAEESPNAVYIDLDAVTKTQVSLCFCIAVQIRDRLVAFVSGVAFDIAL